MHHAVLSTRIISWRSIEYTYESLRIRASTDIFLFTFPAGYSSVTSWAIYTENSNAVVKIDDTWTEQADPSPNLAEGPAA